MPNLAEVSVPSGIESIWAIEFHSYLSVGSLFNFANGAAQPREVGLDTLPLRVA
jgi:hypothetical protein